MEIVFWVVQILWSRKVEISLMYVSLWVQAWVNLLLQMRVNNEKDFWEETNLDFLFYLQGFKSNSI